MIRDKKLIYNYKADQRENKFTNTETLKELELNKLPKYVYSNINKFVSSEFFVFFQSIFNEPNGCMIYFNKNIGNKV